MEVTCDHHQTTNKLHDLKIIDIQNGMSALPHREVILFFSKLQKELGT
jgi:hypothetical protein